MFKQFRWRSPVGWLSQLAIAALLILWAATIGSVRRHYAEVVAPATQQSVDLPDTKEPCK